MYTKLKENRLIIGAVVLVLLAVGLGFYFFPGVPKPLPDTVTFASGKFSFTYPPVYKTREYATGVVSVGGVPAAGAFIPLIDVVQYKSDLQAAAPASFDAFVLHQAQVLCGADASTESVSCTDPVQTPFVTAAGLAGKQIMFTLTRKNLKTAAVTKSAYGPIFVFNTTATPDPGEKTRYEGIFVYPNFSTFLLAPGTGDLVKDIATTLVIK